MQDIARQLESVRRRSRLLLVAQRLAQLLAVAGLVFLGLGFIDYLLRLPGWMRCIVTASLVVFALAWSWRRLTEALGFAPTLSALALRVEAREPSLRGLLASALEFSQGGTSRFAPPPGIASLSGGVGVTSEATSGVTSGVTSGGGAREAMERLSIEAAQNRLPGVRIGSIINPVPTRRVGLQLGAVVLVLAALAAMLPMHAAIAAQRWAAPWGDAAWPRRVQLAAPPMGAVLPIDRPVEFTSRVERGNSDGLRVWLRYRLVDAQGNLLPGEPAGGRSELMTAQGANDGAEDEGVHRTQWRSPADVARRVNSGALDAARLEYWFEAGDDATARASLTLVARPALVSLTAQVQPPAYAAGLVAPQSVALLTQGQRVASVPALRGSTVTLDLTLNKPLPPEALLAEALLPGLSAQVPVTVTSQSDTRHTVRFTLDESVESNLVLTDGHGLTSDATLRYRFEAIEDRPPTANIAEPSADAAVLATAVLPVAAAANDDVGVGTLTLRATYPTRSDADTEPVEASAPLAQRTGRGAGLAAEASLDLGPLSLRPGDGVTIHATARDVFELHGLRHEPVEATPRRLRIIDVPTLVDQVRGDLAGVRRQAVRLERQQSELLKRTREGQEPPAQLGAEQMRIGRSLETQTEQLRRVRERLDLNRLSEPTLDELIRQADALVQDAAQRDAEARERLDEAQQAQPTDPDNPQAVKQAAQARDAAQEQAAAEQEAVRAKLDELAKLLDQGRDALGLKLELTRLQTEQDRLAQDTRELLPRTAGRPPEGLPPELQQALKELAERQAQLAEQTEEAVERLQSTAEALDKQGESDRDKAAAQAMAEAAAVAQRQGLTQRMRESKQAVEENQLAQAGSAQMQSQDTLQEMMRQMGEQDQLRQELLKRRLLALAEKLRNLIEAQTRLNERTMPAAGGALAALGEEQSGVWVRTITLQTEAEGDEKTAPVAEPLDQAAAAQATAIEALRRAGRDDSVAAQAVALERLNAALALVNQKREEAARDETDQQREELRQKYVELAKRQRGLRGEVATKLQETPLTRKARAELRALGQSQSAIRTEAAALSGQLASTIVFRRTQELMEAASSEAEAPLLRGEDDGRVLMNQDKAATLLETMAAALEQAGGRKQEFAEGESGGGGGGGSGGGAPPLIPPAAELKLLRGVQQAVYDETRALGDALQGAPDDGQAQRLGELADEQRELAQLGKRLIESVQQRNTPPPPPPPPEVPPLPESGTQPGGIGPG